MILIHLKLFPEILWKRPFSVDDYDDVPNAYSTCPDCSRKINFENDGGNGFCSNCAPNH